MTTPEKKLKILLVDDTEINREVALMMLEDYGLEIDVAVNGKDAFEKYSSMHYELVFMDCYMPIMDGFESAKCIRQYEQERDIEHTPIVAITASITKACWEQCVDAGMDHFISKPISKQELDESIQRFLGQGQGKGEEIVEEQSQAVDNESLVDDDKVGKLKKILGANFDQFTKNFLVETSGMLADLESASPSSHASDMERMVHSIKSGVANFGAMEMANYAQDVEDRYRAGQFDKVKEEYEKLSKYFAQFRKELEAHLE